jgi:hypothetical protein
VCCGEYCAWLSGCAHLFVIWNFLLNSGTVASGDKVCCEWPILVMVILLLDIYSDGICIYMEICVYTGDIHIRILSK